MKVVILCGGLGTRLSEETRVKPKPMVEVAGKPILMHIIDLYKNHNIKDFILALGYKGEIIKQYFLNYSLVHSDITVSLKSGNVDVHKSFVDDIKITMVDTGALTMTGGRLLRLKEYIGDSDSFLVTYGDGVADVDIGSLIHFHQNHGCLATVTTVRPPARFGEIELDGDCVSHFVEKPAGGKGWINGGFFVFSPAILQYIDGDNTILEREPLERLANDRELMAFKHEGFWQCMDTIKDKEFLESYFKSKY